MTDKPEGVIKGEIREFKPANWITALVILMIGGLAALVIWLTISGEVVDLKPIISIIGTVSGLGLAATASK